MLLTASEVHKARPAPAAAQRSPGRDPTTAPEGSVITGSGVLISFHERKYAVSRETVSSKIEENSIFCQFLWCHFSNFLI